MYCKQIHKDYLYTTLIHVYSTTIMAVLNYHHLLRESGRERAIYIIEIKKKLIMNAWSLKWTTGGLIEKDIEGILITCEYKINKMK